MRKDINSILFSILYSVLKKCPMSDIEKSMCSEDIFQELMNIAKKHDIAHLLGVGALNNGLVQKNTSGYEKVKQLILTAIYRYEKINYEFNEIINILENANIQFVPLKGSVLRKYYPEPWMRTSCDIDILIHKNDKERVKDILVRDNNYRFDFEGSHDVALFSPNNIHLELHYAFIGNEMIGNEKIKAANIPLCGIWEHVESCNGKYQCQMTDDYFYYYHIVHMAKHFEIGGCGIRPFIDLWILDNLKKADQEKRDALLREGGMIEFANIARKLCKCWFENNPLDEVTEKMQNYILRGGVYGTSGNKIAVQQQKKGGKIKYAISRIFIPYDVIKFHYPVLQKHRWLTPFMEVRRWCKLIFGGHAKRTLQELSYNQKISKDNGNEMKTFLKDIGL